MGNLINNLSPTDQQTMMNQMFANRNIDFLERTQKELLSKLNNIYQCLNKSKQQMFNFSIPDQNSVNLTQQKFLVLINKINTSANIGELMKVINSLNETAMQFKSLPLVVREAIMNSSLDEYFNMKNLLNPLNSNMVNLNDYKLSDLKDLTNFWNSFSAKYPAFVTAINQLQLNASQLIFFESLFEIPKGDQGKTTYVGNNFYE
jgi:hypothetical protein